MSQYRYVSYPILHELTQTYDKFLSPRKYVSSLQEGIVQATEQSLLALAASGPAGQWKLTDDIREHADIISFDLTQLREGMHSLGADFNIAMGGVLVNFDMARTEYRAVFNKLMDVFKRDRKTEAEGRLREALKAYRDGCRTTDKPELFAEALKNLQAVIEKHRETPLAYIHIGHIYHYQERQRNFRRALDNYMLCYSFAESDPEQALLAAQASFYAGWLTAAVLGDMQAAIELTQKALACDPRLGEAHYHLAKIYGAFGDTRESLFNLNQAIGLFDRRYCLKVEVDDDFKMIKEELKKALYELAEKDIVEQETWLREHGGTLSDALRINAEDKLEDARRFLDTNDYGQVIKAIVLIDGLRKKLVGDLQDRELSAEEKERRRKQEEEQRKADEEALQRAAEEARMKEELKQRIEAEMKERIEVERKQRRKKKFIKAVLADIILILLTLILCSLIMYGVTVGAFVLALLTSIITVAWLCV